MFSILVVIITHFICDNYNIISYHYTSSQAEFSFCHLDFVLLDDVMGLHLNLTFNKGLYFKICPLLSYYVVMTDYNTKSEDTGNHFEFQDGRKVLNNTRLNHIYDKGGLKPMTNYILILKVNIL